MEVDAVGTLMELRNQRDGMLVSVKQLLEADARVNAAWLSGSFGRGEADAWSDLDLHVAVADEELDAFVAEPETLFRAIGEHILIFGGMSSNSMPGGRFWLVQYRPYMLQIDWNIGPTSETTRPVAAYLLFDRVGIPTTPAQEALADAERRTIAQHELAFFWAMAPLAIKFVGRGHTRLAVKQVEYLEGAYIKLWRVLGNAAALQRDRYHQNRPLEAGLDRNLPRFGPAIDPLATLEVIRRFCAAVADLHPRLAALGAQIDPRVVQEVDALAAIAAVEAGRGGSGPFLGSRR